jgi:hypothetical protein
MIPLLAPIIGLLAEKGLDAVGKLIDKGADKALEVVSEKIGVDITKPETAMQAIQSLTPEQEAALREYDLHLRTLDLDREKSFLADVSDARSMQKEALKQEDTFSKRFIYYFAIVWSFFGMSYIGAVTFTQIPTTSVRFADTILGFLLGTILSGMFAYFYGSSAGSKAKSDAIIAANSPRS